MRRKYNFSNTFTLCGIMIAAMAIMTNGYSGLKAKNEKYIAIEESLESQIEEEMVRSGVLENKNEAVKTDAYKIEIAKRKYGYISEGEIVLMEK